MFRFFSILLALYAGTLLAWPETFEGDDDDFIAEYVETNYGLDPERYDILTTMPCHLRRNQDAGISGTLLLVRDRQARVFRNKAFFSHDVEIDDRVGCLSCEYVGIEFDVEDFLERGALTVYYERGRRPLYALLKRIDLSIKQPLVGSVQLDRLHYGAWEVEFAVGVYESLASGHDDGRRQVFTQDLQGTHLEPVRRKSLCRKIIHFFGRAYLHHRSFPAADYYPY